MEEQKYYCVSIILEGYTYADSPGAAMQGAQAIVDNWQEHCASASVDRIAPPEEDEA